MSRQQLHCVLYVSESNLPAERAAWEIQALLDHARACNKARGITGVLAFTGANFAQYIEGPSQQAAALMEAVHRDPRHKNLVMLRHDTLLQRRLSQWDMAYAPPSLYLARHLQLLPSSVGARRKRLIDRLFRLLTGLVEDAHHALETDGGFQLPPFSAWNRVGEGSG